MQDFIYILLEEFNNDGEIETSVIASSFNEDTIKQAMKDRFEEYKDYGCFDFEEEDTLSIEVHNNYMFVRKEDDDFYGDLQIIKQRVI